MRTHFHLPNCSRRRHYTIVEMMMVMAVFMIILAMVIVAWLNSGPQVKLKSAARMINAQLNLARAKAVAERKPVGVYFSQPGKEYYRYGCRLFYYNKETKTLDEDSDFSPDEGWVLLPEGVVFAQLTVVQTTPSFQYYFTDPGIPTPYMIVFDPKGRVWPSASFNGDLYLTAGTRKDGPLQATSADKNKGEPYFKIEINPFTGRSTTTYHEVND